MPNNARGTASGAMKMKSKLARTTRGARTTPLRASAATKPSGSTMAAARKGGTYGVHDRAAYGGIRQAPRDVVDRES